jgi:hypothetical protein
LKSLNADEYNANLALASIAHDKNMKTSAASAAGGLFATIAGGLIKSFKF